MLEYLNPQNIAAALLVVVPLLVFAARVLSRSEGATLWPVLPAWADVTTWPRWAQPIVPLVAAAGPVLVTQLQAGVDLLPALEAAGAAGFGAIGLYHTGKRIVSGAPTAAAPVANARSKRPQVKPIIGALLFLLATGCASWRPVADQTANVVDAACALGLVRSPAVRAAAEERMVAPEWLASALCALPDAYHAWQDARDQRDADPGRAAVAAAEKAGL